MNKKTLRIVLIGFPILFGTAFLGFQNLKTEESANNIDIGSDVVDQDKLETTEKSSDSNDLSVQPANIIELIDSSPPSVQPGEIGFENIDPALINDSLVQERIDGLKLNRYRIVKLHADELRAKLIENDIPKDIKVRLFNDQLLVGKPYGAKIYYDGPRTGFATWNGSINGDGVSNFIIIVRPDGYVTMKITGKEGTYRLEELKNSGAHILLDYNRQPISYEGDTIAVPSELTIPRKR